MTKIAVPLIFCFQYGEYEQVVVEDRIDKEKARRKAEAEAEELKSAVRVGSLEPRCRYRAMVCASGFSVPQAHGAFRGVSVL